MMQSGIRNAVSTMNSTEMPSTPILYLMEPPSQSISSTNWKPGVLLSKCAQM